MLLFTCCSFTTFPLKCLLLTGSKLEGTLCPVIRTINQDVNRTGPSIDPWGITTSYWPPTGLSTTDHHLLCPALRPDSNPPPCLLNYISYFLRFFLKIFQEYVSKALLEIKVDSSHCFPSSTKAAISLRWLNMTSPC